MEEKISTGSKERGGGEIGRMWKNKMKGRSEI
jgi:hypothetical protein